MRCAITRSADYSEENLRKALLEIIDNSEFPSVSGKTVLIKPNILFDAPPEKAITTDYRAVEALMIILKEMGCSRIIVGDSPGTQTGKLQPRACGILDAAARQGAYLSDFREECRTHEVDGLSIPMASALDEADVVISFAKFKTHQLMSATGTVKNMFGTIPGLNKSPMHLRYRNPETFSRFLIKLYKECHVDYALMDAVIGMEGPGPGSGSPRHIGLMMGSANGYAVDKAEGIIMGYPSLPLIKTAEDEMPGITDAEYPLLRPEELVIPDYIRIKSGVKNTFRSLIIGSLLNVLHRDGSGRSKPVFDAAKCRACSRCVNVCPAKALSIKDGHVVFDKKKCISCYCCHEMCPFDAIKVN